MTFLPHGRAARLGVLGAALALAGAGHARAAGPPPKTNGAYVVKLAGALSGQGNAAVGAKQINVNVTVTDTATGQSGKLIAHLPLDGGRFTGTATVLGFTVTFCGRVEPADNAVVKRALILCTFGLSDGRAGRLIGQGK